MRDPQLALALLGTATGLLTGLVRERIVLACVVIAASVLAAATLPFHVATADRMLGMAWVLLIIVAAVCWLPRSLGRIYLPLVLGSLSGWVTGSLAFSGGRAIGSFVAALFLSTLASACLMRRGWALPIRVIAGWLVAIGALNITLTVLPVTPGYLPDHLE